MLHNNPMLHPSFLGIAALITWGIITLIKVALAVHLELYSDEIFYWQASQYPAWAYSDLPFMSALLAGTGSTLLGHHPFGVRALFVLMGSALPILVYWVALPLTDKRQALGSAALTLCLPMAAILGLLAVPDVPLIFFGLLVFGFLERATRLNKPALWVLVGLTAALGLSSHYRFAPYLVAALTFLTLYRTQWHHARQPLFWVGALIAAIGLYPALSFNVSNDLSALDYHLVSRHPWQFQVEGLLHPLIQAVIVTPLLYILCWYTLWHMIQLARRGNQQAGLAACFAVVNLGVYLLLAPWSDTTRTTIHWPLSGYLPILLYMPSVLTRLWGSSRRAVQRIASATPLLGLAGTLLGLAGLGSQGFNAQLQTYLGTGILSNKMAGWKPLTDFLRESDLLHPDLVIVTDNYYTAAQIAFRLDHAHIYTIDQDKTLRDGRQTQYALWKLDTAALLGNEAGRPLLFITEDSTLNVDRKGIVMERACRLFEDLAIADQLFLYRGDKRFSFYTGSSVRAAPATDLDRSCPMPAQAWLDQPGWDETVSGTYSVSGWAYSPYTGINEVRLLVDGELVGRATRNVAREDVARLTDGHLDPASPSLGFEGELDTSQWRNGRHHFSLELQLNSGELQRLAERDIYIRN